MNVNQSSAAICDHIWTEEEHGRQIEKTCHSKVECEICEHCAHHCPIHYQIRPGLGVTFKGPQ